MSVRNRWLLLVTTLVCYAVLWVGWVQQWTPLQGIDTSLLAAAHRYGVAHPGWVRGWQVYCTVLGPWVFQLVGLVAAVVALVRRRFRVAGFLVVCVVLESVIMQIAKDIAQRSRPLTAFVYEPSWSFPSGHALGTLVGVLGLTAAALVVVAPGHRRRVWVAAGLGAVVVLTIGAGRVLLNVHNPSDVLAGWLLGTAWFCATLPILPDARTSELEIVAKP